MLAIENSEALERSLHVLPMLYGLGVRTMTITHSIRTYAGDGERAHHSGGGLTEFGHDLIASMNQLGMLVDVSHLSVPAFWHAMQATQCARHRQPQLLPRPQRATDATCTTTK